VLLDEWATIDDTVASRGYAGSLALEMLLKERVHAVQFTPMPERGLAAFIATFFASAQRPGTHTCGYWISLDGRRRKCRIIRIA
jgi:hypothetical protein